MTKVYYKSKLITLYSEYILSILWDVPRATALTSHFRTSKPEVILIIKLLFLSRFEETVEVRIETEPEQPSPKVRIDVILYVIRQHYILIYACTCICFCQ